MKKRDRICDVLKQIDLRPYVPQGAYYVLSDVSSLPGKNSKDKAMFLPKQTGVASVPRAGDFECYGKAYRLEMAKNYTARHPDTKR